MRSIYIWTEVFNCAKIGNPALRSYLKYHNYPVNVYGYEDDLEEIIDHPNIIKIKIPQRSIFTKLKYYPIQMKSIISENELRDAYKEGHRGTSLLWTHIIMTSSSEVLIHFDSDVLFLGEIISEIINAMNDADIVGPIRNYKNNPNKRDDVRAYNDVVQTVLFGFKPKLISKFPFKKLMNMVRGTWNPLNHPVIDFFDPVSFNMIKNGARVKFLSCDDVGGTSIYGDRNNCHAEINNYHTNNKLDFGNKLIHFSSAGSGMYYYNNVNNINVANSYVKYAIDRYALYCKVIYNEDLGVDLSMYDGLVRELKKWV